MDIDRFNFKAQLPHILEDIASSRFVSLDVELSGIPRKQVNRSRVYGQDDHRKQTLQQRYLETKAAAQKYRILQLGLTCVQEDPERETYTLRSYNFDLSPLVDRRLRIERDFTYQSDAVDFLLSHGFQMDAPFTKGIPYLSWEEEAEARTAAIAGWDKNELPDIGVSPGDIENLQLLQRVREEIGRWNQTPEENENFLNITPVGRGQSGRSERGLNGYQKRLVHQLVRAEYPDLVSISKPDFIQLVPYDKNREDAQLARKRQGLDRTITEQTGLRLIIDALCSNLGMATGEHLSADPLAANLQTMARTRLGHHETAKSDITSRTEQQRTLFIVGHNLFMDMIYIYACFFGPLPDQVEQFQSILANLFPLIVDTKYLADIINENSPRYKSSLEEIDEELSKIASPTIEIPDGFSKYTENSRMHEAGFDSFLTARVLIRLSAKVDGESIKPHSSDAGSVPNEAPSGPFIRSLPGSKAKDDAEGQQDLPFSNNPDMMKFYNKLKALNVEEPATEPHSVMPSPDSQFWSTFGNKLRVNGTVEEFCEINSLPSTRRPQLGIGQVPGYWVP